MPGTQAVKSDFISELPRRIVQHVECHACGYEPPDVSHPPCTCPKCHGGSWERFIWQSKLLDLPPSPADPLM